MDREMRTVIRDKKFSWKRIIHEVLQESVLAKIMIAIYLNYMPKVADSYMSLFADVPSCYGE